jgi:hypothetical protein
VLIRTIFYAALAVGKSARLPYEEKGPREGFRMATEGNETRKHFSGEDVSKGGSHNDLPTGDNRWSRGQALWLFGGAIAGGAALGFLPNSNSTAYALTSNPITVENQQTGSNGWQMFRPGYSVSDDKTRQIQGYASASSVNKGEQIAFYVTVNPVQVYTIDIYRMGWYNGLGGRLLQKVGPLDGITQPLPTLDSITGLVDCNWSAGYTLSVPDTWTSGIYLAVLTNAQKFQNYIIFVVRDDGRTADLLYQQSVTTYQAYNNYPDDGKTGKSLYDYNSYGANTQATGSARAAKVTFDRPYTHGYGSGQFAYSWDWERYFVRWLERSGYDVTYSTDLDTHSNGSRLLGFKGFLSVGHDEYWSKPMYDAVEAARDSGVNFACFGANAVFQQVRFESSARNVPGRVMVCYKDAQRDPVQGATTTVQWRDPLPNRPEQSLLGVQFTAHLQNDGQGAAYVVRNSSHWVYEGTGFSDGNQVSGILGYEADRFFPDYPSPQGTGYTILSDSPVTSASGRTDRANSSIYQAPSGAWVFTTGTHHWSYGLDKENVVDARIQRATANVLNKFLGSPTPPSDQILSPSNLVATTVSSSQVDLVWTDNADNETAYTVERSLDNSSWQVLTSTLAANTVAYSDTSVGPSKNYYYRVKATSASGASGYSNTASATTPDAAPAAPSNLSATRTGTPKNQVISVKWTDNSSNETNFVIERSTDRLNWGALNSTLPANTTSYSDKNITSRTTYYYRVKASNTIGSSAYSNVASATTK